MFLGNDGLCYYIIIINSDISVLIVCNKTGGTIKGDKEKCGHNAIKQSIGAQRI